MRPAVQFVVLCPVGLMELIFACSEQTAQGWGLCVCGGGGVWGCVVGG